MSAQPAIPWTQSNGVKACLWSVALAVLTWVGTTLAAAGPLVWDGRELAKLCLAPITALVAQFARGDVQAPAIANALSFGLLNSRNPK